ncbi:MAG: NusG domain II-containing protein [Formivibrio sp.]|nr:NusG domain II-containing protein [Formivibrio sp.]
MALIPSEWHVGSRRQWLNLLRPGDWLTLLLALLLVAGLVPLSWHQERATRVRVYQNGKLFGEYDLAAARRIETPGPLGVTVVEVAGGRVRIAKDPSPRQYCVKEGWLDQAGQAAICLPNRTSIELVGTKPRPFDSLSY